MLRRLLPRSSALLCASSRLPAQATRRPLPLTMTRMQPCSTRFLSTTAAPEPPAPVQPTPPDDTDDPLLSTLQLELLSYSPAVLDSYQYFLLTTATHLSIPVGKVWSPRKSEKLRFPVLKSAFVHKKHQVHYEIRTFHRFVCLHQLTGSTADTFLEYVERNLPEGVGLKVTRVGVERLGRIGVGIGKVG